MRYKNLSKRKEYITKQAQRLIILLSRQTKFCRFQTKIILERFYVMSHYVTCSLRYTRAKAVGIIETTKLSYFKVSIEIQSAR